MKKQLVCIDTSYFRSHLNNCHYPSQKFILCISEPVSLELMGTNALNENDKRIRSANFKKILETKMLLPRGQILIDEIQAYLLDKDFSLEFPLCDKKTQNDIRHFIETDCEYLKKIYKDKMEERNDDMQLWESVIVSLPRETVVLTTKRLCRRTISVVENKVKS